MWKRIILYTCLYVFFCCNFVLYLYFCNRIKPSIATKSEIIFNSTLTCGKTIFSIHTETILQTGTIVKNSTKLNSSITNILSNDSISTTEGSDQFLKVTFLEKYIY